MMTGMGAGMNGLGLGSVLLAGAKQIANSYPLAKQALRTPGRAAVREGTKAAVGLARDVLLGHDARSSAEARGVRALKRVGALTLDEALIPYAKRARLALSPTRRKKPAKKKKKITKKKTQRSRGRLGQRGYGRAEEKKIRAFRRAMALAQAGRRGRRGR